MERTTTKRPRRGVGEKASPAGVVPARTELTVAPAVEVELLVPSEPPEPSFAGRALALACLQRLEREGAVGVLP